jgi:GNAT superfamily N-acetyltransferase
MNDDSRLRFADLELARRLEITDALAAVEFARSWALLNSFTGDPFISVAGGHGGFGGVDSPLTQAFGLGLNGPVTEDDMSKIEEFYSRNGAPVNIETCPLADMSLLTLLNARGYHPIEYSNVLVREVTEKDLSAHPDSESEIRVRSPREDEVENYSLVVIKSFVEDAEISPSLFNVFVSCFKAAGTHFFMAEIDGTPVGGGMMSIHQGVGSFGGAGTLASFRTRGVQKALLLARLAKAAREGCDLAMVATMPGSGSQRNVERQGFKVVYTRTKFMRELAQSAE